MPSLSCVHADKRGRVTTLSQHSFTVFTRLNPLGNYFFNPSVAWGINRGRGIIRVLKFERVVGYLREGDYCFNPPVARGINRGRGIIQGRRINRVNTVCNYQNPSFRKSSKPRNKRICDVRDPFLPQH